MLGQSGDMMGNEVPRESDNAGTHAGNASATGRTVAPPVRARSRDMATFSLLLSQYGDKHVNRGRCGTFDQH